MAARAAFKELLPRYSSTWPDVNCRRLPDSTPSLSPTRRLATAWDFHRVDSASAGAPRKKRYSKTVSEYRLRETNRYGITTITASPRLYIRLTGVQEAPGSYNDPMFAGTALPLHCLPGLVGSCPLSAPKSDGGQPATTGIGKPSAYLLQLLRESSPAANCSSMRISFLSGFSVLIISTSLLPRSKLRLGSRLREGLLWLLLESCCHLQQISGIPSQMNETSCGRKHVAMVH